MNKYIYLFALVCLAFSNAFAQATCATAVPLCADGTTVFDGTGGATNVATAEPTIDLGCLGSGPSPSWFYIEAATAGDIDLALTPDPIGSVDYDFAMYGPFADLATALGSCGAGLGAPSDCSFSGGTGAETPSIGSNASGDTTPAAVGDVYLLLVSKFGAAAANFTLNQTGGAGSTDCSILATCDLTLDCTVVVNETCAGDMDGSITVTANSSNTIEYSKDGGTSFQASNTFSGLAAGTYTVVVQDMGDPTCTEMIDVIIAPGVDVSDPTPGANVTIACNDPAPDITAACAIEECTIPSCAFDPASMNISVSFTGTHTFVSDLAFYLEGPAACGSPLLTIVPNPGICNTGDDFTNLTFTNNPADGDFDLCNAATPLTGSYSSVAGVPIDWSSVAGCDINEAGWMVIIGDCVGGDTGELDQVVVTFSDAGGACPTCLGAGGSTVYDSGAGLAAVIDDGACLPGAAAAFAVAVPPAGDPVVTWYNAPTGGTAIGTGSPFNVGGTTAEEGAFNAGATGTYTYYTQCECPDGCTSDRSAVTVTVGICCMLDVTCPTGPVALECIDEVPALADAAAILAEFTAKGGGIVESCNPVVITFVDADDGAAGCMGTPRTVTRTFTVTDPITGETQDCPIDYVIMDVTPPVTPAAPLAVDVECASDVPAPADLTAVDNCDGDITVSPSVVITPGTCDNQFTMVRTWTFIDVCGNESSVSQTINVDDVTGPVITCPADITLSCDEDTAPEAAGSMSGTITGVNTTSLSWPDAGTGLIGSLTAAAAGAPAGAEITGVTVNIDLDHSWVGDLTLDLISPDGTTIPLIAGSCGNADNISTTFDDAGGALPCNASATAGPHEDCPGDYATSSSISGTVAPIGSLASLNGENANGTWTLNVVDGVGGDAGCVINFSVDVAWETIGGGVGGDAGPAATAIDNCDVAPVITFADVTVAGTCNGASAITRTWTATDACGNVSTCDQIITVEDATPPVIVCPAALTVECDASTDPADTGMATATDNCDAAPVITFADVTVVGACPQESVITRTWTATDACGNATACDQIITLEDTTPPVIVCPADLTIECDASTEPANTGAPTATDNCDAAPVFTFVDVAVAGTCDGESVITRTWTATDACGNASTCNQVVTLEDTTPPVLACPADITLGCDQNSDPGAGSVTTTGTITGVNAGSSSFGDGDTGLVASVTAPASGAPAGAEVTGVTVNIDLDHSWVGDLTLDLISPDGTTIPLIAGSCGNTDNISTTFDDAGGALPCNASATAGPHEDCPGDFATSSSISGIVAPIGSLASLNGENANGTWTLNVTDGVGGDGGCLINFSVDVAWTFTENPGGGGDAGPFATAADACDPNAVVTYTDVLNPLTVGYSISRTWVAVDACGNESSCVQTITVEDCDVAITDPCACVNNSSTIDLDTGLGGGDGQFSELVAITGPGGGPVNNPNLIFEVIAITGGVDAFAAPPIPPAQTAGVPVPLGTQLVYNPVTMHYELPFYHYDGVGYTITVQQIVGGLPGQILGPIGNNCAYPDPIFDPALQSLYCPNGAAVTLGGIDQNGVGADGVTFTVDGAPATVFDPSAVAKGFYTIVMTFDGADDGNGGLSPDGGATPAQPGCIQEVTQTVEVNDVEAPVITCPADATLSCDASSDPADTGEATAIDNCDADPVITFADITTQGAEGCGQFTYSIARTWTATDACDNATTCVQTINVADTTPPVITCPPSQTLTCFEVMPAPFTTAAAFIAAGGTIADDCTVDFTDFTVFAQNDDNGGDNCPANARLVTRTYFIQDACGNTSTCEQVFTYLESTQGPVITSVLPACYKYCASLANPMETDITYTTDCSFGATVNIDGPTFIGQDNCPGSIVRYTYTVTDDCGRTSEPVVRDFIVQNDGPTVECSAFNLLLECGDPNNLDYIAAHIGVVNANSSCGSDVTISHSPQNFNNITCNSSTVVTFIATDDCGRTASCTTTVNISDNTAPEITSVYEDGICNEGVCGSNLNFWYNAWKDKVMEGLSATDACDTNVSISPQGPSSPNQNCPDETTETVVNFVATDNCGNTSFIPYSFYVTALDTPEPPQASSISGMVHTESMEAVEDVEVYLSGGASFFEMFVTGNDGNYAFNNVPLEQNYSITPLYDQFPMNGVSSYDLILIAQHILSVDQLDSPYKMIAADINRSGSITTLDLVELRKMILYINSEFTNNTSWRFVDADFVFPYADNPFATAFPEVIGINGLLESVQHDFVGVKTGDVNESAVPNNLSGADDRSFNDELPFKVRDVQMKAGETYEAVFSSSDFKAIAGYQYTLNFNDDLLEFVNVNAGDLAGMSEANFGLSLLDEGAITTSWTNNVPVSMKADAELFRITFKAKRTTQLSEALSINSRYTTAEAYDVSTENGQLNLLNVTLRFEDAAGISTPFALLQNTPNPFRDETVIGFVLPESTSATLTIFDVSGKQLKLISGDYEAGYNEVSLDRGDLAEGMLYYQLETANNTATKKMILTNK